MKEQKICSKCKGKGTVRDDIDWFMGIFTFGISALMDVSNQVTCKVCNGKGYIEND